MTTPDARSRFNTTPAETQARAISRRAVKQGEKAIAETANRLSNLQVVYLPATSLRPNTYNPNRMPDREFDLLKQSMLEDGFTQPVLVNADHSIIDGEHRWRAAQAIGLTSIPAVVINMTDAQMRIATIRHNRARGSHDLELETAILRDLQALGLSAWAQKALLITDSELNRMLATVGVPEIMTVSDHTQAWVPDTSTPYEIQYIQEGRAGLSTFVHPATQQTQVWSISDQAARAIADKDTATRAATTEQERLHALHTYPLLRIRAMYQDDEARLIRAVLGNNPSETLLAVCRDIWQRTANSQ